MINPKTRSCGCYHRERTRDSILAHRVRKEQKGIKEKKEFIPLLELDKRRDKKAPMSIFDNFWWSRH